MDLQTQQVTSGMDLCLCFGNEYGTTTGEAGDYASQFYWNRQNNGSNPYLWARDMEMVFGDHGEKLSAGSADQVANTLNRGTYLTGGNYNGSTSTTWAVDATSANTASKVVARDGSGDFSAGTITATLSGTATNATNINISATSTTDTTTYPTLVANSATGNQAPFIDTGLSYNANTDTLIAGTFSGAFSGTATNANNINCSATTDSTTSPVLVGSSAGGNSAPLVDSDLGYDASSTNPLLKVGIATHGGIRIGSSTVDSYDSTGNGAISSLDVTRHRQGRFPASGGITNAVGTAGIRFSDGDVQRQVSSITQTAGSFAIFGRSSTTCKSDNFIWGSPYSGLRVGYATDGGSVAGFILSKTTKDGVFANPVDILTIAGDTDNLSFNGNKSYFGNTTSTVPKARLHATGTFLSDGNDILAEPNVAFFDYNLGARFGCTGPNASTIGRACPSANKQ